MKKIKKNSGVTLITLIIYIILTLLILAILSTLVMNFRKNLNSTNVQTVHDIEFDKLNLQLLKETKEQDNLIDTVTDNTIIFSNGNQYQYVKEEKAIFLNNSIKIAEYISNCNFTLDTVNKKQKLTVEVEIEGKKRMTEYIGFMEIFAPGMKADENIEYSSDNKIAIIPAGFTLSGLPEESTIDGGLVIYLIPEGETVNWEDGAEVATAQTEYDQFVWIPISHEQINNMYICQAKNGSNGDCDIQVVGEEAKCITHNSTLMAGNLYANDLYDKFEEGYTKVYTPNTGLREPDVLTSYDNNATYLTKLSNILGTTEEYNSIANFKQSLQTEYNEVVKSVYENQGFYIGRYETSGMSDSVDRVTVKSVAGTTTGLNSIMWYIMYAQQKLYAENNNLTTIKSTMIQGAAYDQVMKFVENGIRPDGNSYTIKTIGNVEHSPSFTLYQTGGLNYPSSASIGYNDKVKNIYDLEGNLSVWTTETYSTNYRLCRGANFNYGVSASYRSNNLPDELNIYIGSCLQLYIIN